MEKRVLIFVTLFVLVFMVNVNATKIHSYFSIDYNIADDNINVSLDSIKIDNSVLGVNEISNDFLLIQTIYNNGSIAESKNTGFNFISDGVFIPFSYVSQDFNYNSELKYIRVYFNNTLKLTVTLNLCNQNNICDGNENYLSCSDCKYYDGDGICVSPKQAFNLNLDYWKDHYCDSDCYNDKDCYKASCNDEILNQNEVSIDTGGVCDIINANCGDGVCGKGENYQTCGDCRKAGLNLVVRNSDVKAVNNIYEIPVEILCNGDCNNVNASLFYISRDSFSGSLDINHWTLSETKNCGNMKDNSCFLKFNISAVNGEYANIIQINSLSENLNSDVIMAYVKNVYASKFSSGTSDLTGDLSSVKNLVLATKDGKLEFQSEGMNLNNANLDDNVIMTKNGVDINTEELAMLNVPAIFTLYNQTINNPKILIDGAECSDCEILSYENNILKFKVNHFSSYIVVENISLEEESYYNDETTTSSGSGGNSRGSSGGSEGGGGLVNQADNKSDNQNQIETATPPQDINQLIQNHEGIIKKTYYYLIFTILLFLGLIIAMIIYIKRTKNRKNKDVTKNSFSN